jgi:hypothetical protein
MAYNDITGDAISTRFGSKEAQEKFDQSFDTIFGEKKKKTNGGWTPPPLPLNEYPETSWDDGEERIENIGRNSNEGLHYEK